MLDVLEIDGLEVFNAATTLKRYNAQAFEYATMKKLPMTAGSDAHHEAAIGTAYTILHTEDFSVKGILGQITQGHGAEPALSVAERTRCARRGTTGCACARSACTCRRSAGRGRGK